MGFGFLGGRPTVGGPVSATAGITAQTASFSQGSVVIAGTAPSAVGNLQIIQQGGSAHTLSNSQLLSWTAATAGAAPISYYRVYDNGVQINTNGATTGTSYTATATGSNFVAAYVTETSHPFTVTAVDTNGVEGPAAAPAFYMYYQGTSICGGVDFSYGMTVNWAATAQVKSPATHSVSCTVGATNGGFQPYTSQSGTNGVPQYDMAVGPFNYFVFDMWAPSTLSKMTLALHARPGGNSNPRDVYSMYITTVVSGGSSAYGTFVANTWCRYRVPIAPLGMGNGTFTGYILSNNVVVQSVNSGVGPDAGCWVYGQSMPTGTYINDKNGNSSAIGTFPLTCGPGTAIPNQGSAASPLLFSCQRVSLYKPDMNLTFTGSGIAAYFDNFGYDT